MRRRTTQTTRWRLNCKQYNSNKPAAAVQRCCHSSAVTADVVVLSRARPTPSAVVHVPLQVSFSPDHLTVVAVVVQFEHVPCPPRVARKADVVAAALNLNILCAVVPQYVASLC